MNRLSLRGRGQGMTEYIVIVGLVAILLIFAVRKYAFSVNEAIVGTDEAFKTHKIGQAPSSSGGSSGSEETTGGNRNGLGRAGTLTTGAGTEVVYGTEGNYQFENGTPLTSSQAAQVRKD